MAAHTRHGQVESGRCESTARNLIWHEEKKKIAAITEDGHTISQHMDRTDRLH